MLSSCQWLFVNVSTFLWHLSYPEDVDKFPKVPHPFSSAKLVWVAKMDTPAGSYSDRPGACLSGRRELEGQLL
jgi:hypothetical protein